MSRLSRAWELAPTVFGLALLLAAVASLAALTLVVGQPQRETQTFEFRAERTVLAIGEADWPAIAGLGPFLNSNAFRELGLGRVALKRIASSSDDQVVRDLKSYLTANSQVAAVFTASIGTARRIQMALPDMPLVFEGVGDAQRACVVDSLISPGHNATGYQHLLDAVEPRMLQVLHDAFADLTEVVVLVSALNRRQTACEQMPSESAVRSSCQMGVHGAKSAIIAEHMDTHALTTQALREGLALKFLLLCESADASRLGAFLSAGSGVLVPWQNMLDRMDPILVPTLERLKRPAIAARTGFARHGGLMALSVQMPPVEPRESYRLLGQVLSGISPSVLPVSTPHGMRLTMNARAAAAQGLRPAIAVWQRADEVLQ